MSFGNGTKYRGPIRVSRIRRWLVLANRQSTQESDNSIKHSFEIRLILRLLCLNVFILYSLAFPESVSIKAVNLTNTIIAWKV